MLNWSLRTHYMLITYYGHASWAFVEQNNEGE
jgi:hypothetical protein